MDNNHNEEEAHADGDDDDDGAPGDVGWVRFIYMNRRGRYQCQLDLHDDDSSADSSCCLQPRYDDHLLRRRRSFDSQHVGCIRKWAMAPACYASQPLHGSRKPHAPCL